MQRRRYHPWPGPWNATAVSYEDNLQFSFNSSRDLIKFRALLQRKALLTSKQTITLDGSR